MRKNMQLILAWAGMLATLAAAGGSAVAAALSARSAAVRASRERGDNNSTSNVGWILLVLAILALATPVLIAWFTGKLGEVTSQ